MAKTRTEFRLEIVEAYRRAKQPWPVSARTIAAWAVRNHLWEAPVPTRVDLCAREIADALAEYFITDPQDRRVRKMHPFRKDIIQPDGTHKQETLWLDMTDVEVEPKDIWTAFQQNRRRILGECVQLNRAIESYNDNNVHGAHFQMEFDFGPDILEMKQPEEYPYAAGVTA